MSGVELKPGLHLEMKKSLILCDLRRFPPIHAEFMNPKSQAKYDLFCCNFPV